MSKKVFISIALTVIAFAICSLIAFQQRGYFAFGGEYLLFVIPVIVAAFDYERGF